MYRGLGADAELLRCVNQITKETKMKFAFVPSAAYTIGQHLLVHGKPCIVESYHNLGKSFIVVSMPDALRYERTICIINDAPPIEGITS